VNAQEIELTKMFCELQEENSLFTLKEFIAIYGGQESQRKKYETISTWLIKLERNGFVKNVGDSKWKITRTKFDPKLDQKPPVDFIKPQVEFMFTNHKKGYKFLTNGYSFTLYDLLNLLTTNKHENKNGRTLLTKVINRWTGSGAVKKIGKVELSQEEKIKYGLRRRYVNRYVVVDCQKTTIQENTLLKIGVNPKLLQEKEKSSSSFSSPPSPQKPKPKSDFEIKLETFESLTMSERINIFRQSVKNSEMLTTFEIYPIFGFDDEDIIDHRNRLKSIFTGLIMKMINLGIIVQRGTRPVPYHLEAAGVNRSKYLNLYQVMKGGKKRQKSKDISPEELGISMLRAVMLLRDELKSRNKKIRELEEENRQLRERINKPARTPEDLNIHELLDDLLQEG